MYYNDYKFTIERTTGSKKDSIKITAAYENKIYAGNISMSMLSETKLLSNFEAFKQRFIDQINEESLIVEVVDQQIVFLVEDHYKHLDDHVEVRLNLIGEIDANMLDLESIRDELDDYFDEEKIKIIMDIIDRNS